MADENWKKRVGIPNFNYSSGDDEDEDNRVVFRNKNINPANLEFDNSEIPSLSSTDDLIQKYEIYGSTPPRTKIKNKSRDWDRKQKVENPSVKMRGQGRLARPRADRRNTVDCALLNQMIIEPSIDESKRNDKRQQALLRESERDIKMAINVTTIQRASMNRASGFYEERAESLPQPEENPTTLIETCKKFMSVSSRPIGNRTSAPPIAFDSLGFAPADVPQNRKDFHETFSNLIKLGSIDKQDKNTKSIISSEDRMFQTKVNDLIWLELQAWHADRSMEQQDKYLFAARQNIGDLLKEIMNYKFQRHLLRTSSDSGIESTASSTQEDNLPFCFGCLSMYCKDCSQAQSTALKQVESLLMRLESAESLYPSTKAMGQNYPLYSNEKFVGRVKAMCLWYNMTRHHRLKLLILGKLLARLQGQKYKWPVTETESSSSSVQDSDESVRDSNETKTELKVNKPKVHFTTSVSENESFTQGSAAESINSESEFIIMTNSNPSQSLGPAPGEYGKFNVNLYNLKSLTEATYNNVNNSTSLYRKYIENVLKSRGLGNSLSFLHRLHNVVLRKAHITLEKPGSYETDYDNEFFDDEDVPIIEPLLEKEQEEELKRFGVWSQESKDLCLPSYVSAFIFLSLIPLEVIHEFLRMRLETRPMQPNPLSLEQLMKELREGLTLAMIHRERFHKHITTALCDREAELENYINILDEFDTTLKRVFELYLEYAEQWVLVATPESHRKSALDEEWRFTKLVSPMIPGQHAIAAKKFCVIIEKLLQRISDKLISRVTELNSQTSILEETSPKSDSVKWQLLAICRETQQLFTIERERCIKVMTFAKSMIRDIEKIDFHRDHQVEELLCRRHDFVCPAVTEAVKSLKRNALKLRENLTLTIERVQNRCNDTNMMDMDDNDKISVLSRTREILHQGYKFGFEYHKDLVRIYETKIAGYKAESEANLSLAIVGFAKLWMKFVTERCERGRGLRPRWATHGLDFLITACDPQNTYHLSPNEFNELKKQMDACISHVVGSISESDRLRKSPRSRKSSPTAVQRTRTPTRTDNSLNNSPRVYTPQMSLKEKSIGASLSPIFNLDHPDGILKQTSCDIISIKVPKRQSLTPELRHVRIRDAVNRLDMHLENHLREKNLIGNVKELSNCDKVTIRARSVNFSWHRGIKIGQGRFGKVYTAVNNSTGELMAMKEIQIQPGETRVVKRAAEELKIFEGISHKHLVKYNGVEIHREELLIFMELCSEGTLESLVELSGGLYESITRRFTAQLLSAVCELHNHGVVHRDIKTANIFLTNDGNCLKLGDFGSAVKIQAHTTMPGELKGYVGTQAYMAPEVFTKTNTDGHGRAADIWSVGCVVIEMSSGKRPWYQFDSNFQIMFKVGMGETPEVPASLSQEGQDFIDICLQHDPSNRQTAPDLLQHHFCKVGLEDCDCNDTEKEIRRSFRKNLKLKT